MVAYFPDEFKCRSIELAQGFDRHWLKYEGAWHFAILESFTVRCLLCRGAPSSGSRCYICSGAGVHNGCIPCQVSALRPGDKRGPVWPLPVSSEEAMRFLCARDSRFCKGPS